MFDRYRILPRTLLGAYILIMLASAAWFMQLENPTGVQLGFVTAIGALGAGAVWKIWSHAFPKCGGQSK